MPHRSEAGHKGDFGKILFIAGSPGLTGAATLASYSSLRIGGGLTVLGVPRSMNNILEQKLTEVMTKPLPETREGTLAVEAYEEIRQLIKWADVLAIGPGLSMHPETCELVRKIVSSSKLPTVIDADGLNAFAGHAKILENNNTVKILTPHYGELSRIIDVPIEDISRNRIEIVRECALRFHSVVVLKGAPTVVADLKGNVFINSTGNSGLATAGSGDVLTGMIAGLLGQRCSTLDSAICGVFLHGMAGDIAAETVGKRSLVAGDIINYIPDALHRIETLC